MKFSPKISNRNLLIIHLDHLGDICTLIPSVFSLHEFYRISIICKSGMELLWKEFLPLVTVYPVTNMVWSAKNVVKELSAAFSIPYFAVIVPTIAPYAAFLSSLATAGKRIGMIENGKHFKGSRVLYNYVYNAPANEHVSERFSNLFKLVDGIARKPVNPPYSRSAPNGNRLLIHPGATWKSRRWPVDRFLKVAKEISRQNVFCDILIHESEKDLITYFENEIQNTLISIVLTRNTQDLVRAVRSCSLFLGNDSGPAHLANLLQKKTIVLWGPGNYDRIRPLGENNDIVLKSVECRPCRQSRDGEFCRKGENICLLLIQPEEVVLRVMSKL